MILDLFLALVQGLHHQRMRKNRIGSKRKPKKKQSRRRKKSQHLRSHPRLVLNGTVVKVLTKKVLVGAITRVEEDEDVDEVGTEPILILRFRSDRCRIHLAPFHLHRRVHGPVRVQLLVLLMTMTNKTVIPVVATKEVEEREIKSDDESDDDTIVVDHPVTLKIRLCRKVNGLYLFLNW